MPKSKKEDIRNLVKKRAKRSGKTGAYKASVPAKEMLDYIYKDTLPDIDSTFENLIKDLDEKTRDLYEKVKYNRKKLMTPTTSALSNCHGVWTEHIFDVVIWNTISELNSARTDGKYLVYVKLPNRRDATDEVGGESVFWTSLLGKEPYSRIMRKKEALGAKLESSNPDAVILCLDQGECDKTWDPGKAVNDISKETQTMIEGVFAQCKGKVQEAGQIVAFLSVKSSTRPDRRYQFILEGNSSKGLYGVAFDGQQNAMKLGVLMDKKFYAFSLEKRKDADHAALDGLIMFASLFNEAVGATPAIDALFDCVTPAEVAEKVKEICA